MANYQVISIKFSENPCKRYFFQDENCLYAANKEKNDKIYLNCIEVGCECKAKIEDNLMIRTNGKIHNHDLHQVLAEFEIKYNRLKTTVNETTTPIRDLHIAAIREMSAEAAGLMNWENVKCTLHRIRRENMPPCRNIDEFDRLLNIEGPVFECYGKIREKTFYSGSVDGQIFFSHPNLISALEGDIELFVDATFSIVPYHQEQLLVVMANILGKPRPIIYVIMSHKTEEVYTKVFQFIKDGIFPANNCFGTPTQATMDFEIAMRNAAKNVWPNINVFGCNFHFCQCLRRKARSFDYLKEKIKNCPKYKEILMMFMRSSLLPIEMINDGIEAIKKFVNDDKELAVDYFAFIEYFDSTWLNRYTPEDWCTSGQRHRTNNHVEGYNGKIKQFIPINPSPYIFLDGLLNLAYDADAQYQRAKLKPKIYKDASTLTPYLKLLLPQLQEGTLDEIEFLSKMASV